VFQNREEAGELLTDRLSIYKKQKMVLVVAIPRGGVVVARQIATKLSLPLSIIVVKKLGAPANPELAIGALAPDGVRYIDFDLALRSGVEQEYLDREIRQKKEEVEERIKKFQIPNSKFQIKNNKIFILVDDGVATGATVLAAIRYIKESQKSKVLPRRQAGKSQKYKIILAVPVIAKETYNKLQTEVDEIVALEIPESFNAVGQFYKEFPQVSDEEVIKLLK